MKCSYRPMRPYYPGSLDYRLHRYCPLHRCHPLRPRYLCCPNYQYSPCCRLHLAARLGLVSKR